MKSEDFKQPNLEMAEQSSSPATTDIPPQSNPPKRSGIWVGLGIGLVIGLGSGAFLLAGQPAPAASEQTEAETQTIVAQTITTAAVTERSVDQTLAATGTVAPVDLLPIAPRTSGLQIREVLVDDGSLVSAGQVLVVLDDAVLQAQIRETEAAIASARATVEQRRANLAQAEAQLAEAETNLQRYANLSNEGVVSRQEYDSRVTTAETARQSIQVAIADITSAEAQVQSQQARLQQLQTQLEQTLVVAPANGIIAERQAFIGDVASTSDPLFSLIRDGRLELQVQLSEVQLPQVQVGSPVTVTSDADDRIQVQGSVREILPLIDPQTREATVVIDLPGSPLLRSGMFLQANLTVGAARGLTIPAAALLPRPDGTSLVYRITPDGVAEPVSVTAGDITTLGSDGEAIVQVTGDLQAGDRVALSGANYLNPGDQVTVVAQ